MQLTAVAPQRLSNQRLIASSFARAAEVVQWLGAVQAQDYAGAKWSLGLRLRPAAEPSFDAGVKAEFNAHLTGGQIG